MLTLIVLAVVVGFIFVFLNLPQTSWQDSLRNPPPPAAPVADDFSADVDVILFGATLIDDGIHYYPDWVGEFRREYDDSVKPLVKQYYDASVEVAQRPQHARREAAEACVIVR